MSNIKSNLVFDFPDPSPRFEFDKVVKSKAKSKSGGRFMQSNRFGKFKPLNKVASKSSHGLATSKNGASTASSPDKSTATTASASSFDESAFDDFDDEVFDFGRAKYEQTSNNQTHFNRGAVNSTRYELTATNQPSFEMADTSQSHLNISHKPLKLASSSNFHSRTPSAHSFTGYISEVSEFSFDRVTVNTNETPMTGMSSNVSWNFLEENKDLNLISSHTNGAASKRDRLGFVPYTGGKTSGINVKDVIYNHHNGDKHSDYRTYNQSTPRQQIKINMDNMSFSDKSHELPISGIVDSNQSIISEISDVNMYHCEMTDAVKMHLRKDTTDDIVATSNRKTSVSPPQSDVKTSASLHYPEDPNIGNNMYNPPSIFEEFETYKQLRMQYLQQRKLDVRNDNNTSKEGSTVLESIAEKVHMGLGFCTWYLCGTDTTLPQTGEDGINREMTKEDRQREMDARLLGKLVFCNYEC